MPKGTENLWNKDDVAEFLNYKVKTIEKWVGNGIIKRCNTPGNEWRFDPEYIRSFKKTDFESIDSLPEVKRLKRYYEREIEIRDKKISMLEIGVRNILAQSAQVINEATAKVEFSVI